MGMTNVVLVWFTALPFAPCIMMEITPLDTLRFWLGIAAKMFPPHDVAHAWEPDGALGSGVKLSWVVTAPLFVVFWQFIDIVAVWIPRASAFTESFISTLFRERTMRRLFSMLSNTSSARRFRILLRRRDAVDGLGGFVVPFTVLVLVVFVEVELLLPGVVESAGGVD
eukprot:PhF_6_TR8972/c0_g1_i1/m.14107